MPCIKDRGVDVKTLSTAAAQQIESLHKAVIQAAETTADLVPLTEEWIATYTALARCQYVFPAARAFSPFSNTYGAGLFLAQAGECVWCRVQQRQAIPCRWGDEGHAERATGAGLGAGTGCAGCCRPHVGRFAGVAADLSSDAIL
jgi:hypothetical protein